MSDCLPSHTSETSTVDNLAGCGNIKTQPFILIAGTYARGDILFKTATAGELTNKATTAGALDADAFAVMPFDVVLAADDSLAVFIGGEFNEDAVTGYTALASIKTVLSERGVSLRQFG